ncbi:helix-turn-helix domain-containing protein [Nocardiopsis eucommiae]|uniref:Helix-turn-helix domain-containing protein n=1 Tax=Nocardiopsis eucommiae TaxID=2831970 RepID=A0A975L888_9ACTN|nr:helix-turn-helix domain-containing protein [Nocardiopsis eucommiae]
MAILIAAEGRPVSDDSLAEGLWGESQPRNPASALQVYVSRLRRVLPGTALRRSPAAIGSLPMTPTSNASAATSSAPVRWRPTTATPMRTRPSARRCGCGGGHRTRTWPTTRPRPRSVPHCWNSVPAPRRGGRGAAGHRGPRRCGGRVGTACARRTVPRTSLAVAGAVALPLGTPG